MLVLILWLIHAGNCVYSQPKPVSEKSVNIFTLGDSNGTYPHSWPKQLEQALPNAQVVNISRSGRTIGFVNNGDSTLNSLLVLEQNLENAARATGTRRFDYIIIELGTNDAKAVFADRQEEVPKNLEVLVQRIKRCSYDVISKAKIIIISPPPYGHKTDTIAKYQNGGSRVAAMAVSFKRVARKNGCLFVNGFETPGLDIDSMTEDGIHLDATASRKLIEPVLKLIK